MKSFAILYRLMSPRRRRQFWASLALMLVGAAAELTTIGVLLPFLALLGGAGTSVLPHSLQPVIARLGPTSLSSAWLLVIAATVSAAFMRMLIVWVTQSFTAGLAHDMATRIFGRALRQPYPAYLQRNSSELLGSFEKLTWINGIILQPAMQGAAAVVLAFFIAAFLFLIDPVIAGIATALVIAVYLVLGFLLRRRLAGNARVMAQAVTSRTKLVRESFGAIRDILLDRSQRVFEEQFRRLDESSRRAFVVNSTMAAIPRFVVEAIGVSALALAAFVLSLRHGSFAAAIPVLGALGLGAQRLLPLVQQAYGGWSQVTGNRQALDDVLAMMRLEVVEPPSVTDADGPALEDIRLDGICYNYPDGAPVLQGVDLTIPRGGRIGITGPSGSGKSTLLDLLMGLLEPTRGTISIGGRVLDDRLRAAWQRQIAHVPQAIFLSDASIAANIAFGLAASEIDRQRLEAAALAAQLGDFIATLADGYETRVGERGVRLSGGQRQRIGIARALYKNAPVLILDEATSALDDATEAAVIDALAQGERTMVIVAHRASALARCDRLVTLDKGRLR